MSTGTDFLANLQKKDCEEYSTAETAEESKCICCGCLGFTGSRSWKKRNLWKLWQMFVKVRMLPHIFTTG